jgi:Tetratricopeptide repeat
MIPSHSRLAPRKYHLWIVYCGLILFINLSFFRIHASPGPLLYSSKEAKFYAGVVSSAQENQQRQQLEPSKPIERELAGGQSHSYQMTLAAGQYVRLVIGQRGIDVVVKLFGPDGKQAAAFNSEIRTQGRESLEWVGEAAGSYRVDVSATYKNAAAGRYEIQVVDLRLATEDDRALHEARKLNTEFFRLYRAGKYDEARPLGERALEIRERVLGSGHPEVGDTLIKFGEFYTNTASPI